MFNNGKSKIFNSTFRKFTIFETSKYRKLKNVDFESIKHNNYKLEGKKSKNYETKPTVNKNLQFVDHYTIMCECIRVQLW